MESSSNSKRRRGLGIVTANACTECRKKRAKCDGKTPCGRCTAQTVDCHYELPVRQSKEQMRSDLESARTSQRQHERLLSALVSGESADQVLEQLRGGETVESIVEKLESGSHSAVSASNTTTSFSRIVDQESIGNALSKARSVVSSPLSLLGYSDREESGPRSQGQAEGSAWPTWGGGDASAHAPQPTEQEDRMVWDLEPLSYPQQVLANNPLVGTWDQSSDSVSQRQLHEARGSGQATILGPNFGLEEKPEKPDPNLNQGWTAITNDGAFVEHLMALYFCWEYPTFASLNKEHFLGDMRAGNPRFCSPLLVNALLAVGCRFSTQPEARTDPNDRNTAGDHFFAEASRLLDLETDRHCLTTIQALGLMSIREASCGRSSQSIYLSGQSIRLAIQMGLHFDSPDDGSEQAKIDHAVRSATFWGAFSLDQVWSMSIGRLPHFSRNAKLVTKPPILEHIESTSWIPYTDDGAPLETACTQPSNVRSVYKTFCELSEIVHKSLYMLYTPGKPVTSQSLNNVYTEYSRWYSEIPTTLRLGHNFTPSVLFAHMYYHTAILLLFRPFVKLNITGSGVSPRDLCHQAASTISILLKSYSDLYTLEHTPSFVPYFMLASTVTHLATLGTQQAEPEQFQAAMADLRQMTSCHGFANRALNIVRFLVAHWNVTFTMLHDDEEEDLKQDFAESCKSSTTSMNFFCPNVDSADIVSGIGPVPPGGTPLFLPFPLQGRPLLNSNGTSLWESGFSLRTD